MIRQITFFSYNRPAPPQNPIETVSPDRFLRDGIPNVLPQQFLRFAQFKQLKEDTYKKRFQQLLSPDTLSEKEKIFYEKLLKFIFEKKIPFKELCEVIENFAEKIREKVQGISSTALLAQTIAYALFWDLEHNIRPMETLRKLGVGEEILKKMEKFPETLLALLHDGEIVFYPGLPAGEALLVYNHTTNRYGHNDPTWLPDFNSLLDRSSIFHELYHAYQDQKQFVHLVYVNEINAYLVGSLLGILSFKEEDRNSKVTSLIVPKNFVHFQKAVIAAAILLKHPHGEKFAKAWGDFLTTYRMLSCVNVLSLIKITKELNGATSNGANIQKVKQILKSVNQKLETLLKKYGDEKALAQLFPDPTDLPSVVQFARTNPMAIKDVRSYHYLLEAKALLVDALRLHGDPEGEEFDAFLERMLPHPLTQYVYMSFRYDQLDGIERTHIESVPPWGEASEKKALRLLEADKGLTQMEQEGFKNLFSLVRKYKIPWKDLYDIASSMPKHLKEDKEIRWQSRLLSQWIHYAVMYVLANRFWPFNKATLQNFEAPWRGRLLKFRSVVLEALKKWNVVAAPGKVTTTEHKIIYSPSQNAMQTSQNNPFFIPETAWEWNDYFQEGLCVVLDKEKYKNSAGESFSWLFLSGALLSVHLIRGRKLPDENQDSLHEESVERYSPTSSFLAVLSGRDKAESFFASNMTLAKCYLTPPSKRNCREERDAFEKHSREMELTTFMSAIEAKLDSLLTAELGPEATHIDKLELLRKEAEERVHSLLDTAKNILNNPNLNQETLFNQTTFDTLLSAVDREGAEEDRKNLLVLFLELSGILQIAQHSLEILDLFGLSPEWNFGKREELEEWTYILYDKYGKLIKSADYDGLNHGETKN